MRLRPVHTGVFFWDFFHLNTSSLGREGGVLESRLSRYIRGGGRGKTSHRSIAIEKGVYPTNMKISLSIFYFHPIHNMLLKWHKRIDLVKRLFVSSKLVFTQVFQKSRFCVGTHSSFQPSPAKTKVELSSFFQKQHTQLIWLKMLINISIGIGKNSLPILIHKFKSYVCR